MNNESHHWLPHDDSVQIIRNTIKAGTPACIGKLGANECQLVYQTLFLKKKNLEHWSHMETNAGIYPMDSEEKAFGFASVLVNALQTADVLSPWNHGKFRGEESIYNQFVTQRPHRVKLSSLDPLDTWEDTLKGKKVAVVTPFRDTVLHQVENNQERGLGIPSFEELTVIRSRFPKIMDPENGFDDYKHEQLRIVGDLASCDYDIALIGCGGLGLVLASYSKLHGKIGIHTGGPTQLLFRVLGGRWENHPLYADKINENWIRPFDHERPQNYKVLEKRDGAPCYF